MQDKIKAIIMDSLKELNEQLDDDHKLTITNDMPIYGKNSTLDSFDFVNLMVIVEDHIFQELGKSVTIVSEKAFSKKYNPFSNVERMTGFIKELLESEES